MMSPGPAQHEPGITRLVARNRQLERENAMLRTGKPAISKREAQVYRLLANGMTVSEVGTKLFLSVKTISTYRARILEKFDLRNNAGITMHAIRNQVIEVDLLPIAECIIL